MYLKETPLQIDGINNNIYAGFWARIGSLFLDLIIILPIIFFIQYINGFGKNLFFITLIPNILFGLWYHVYLPKKYSGTPGKLIVGNKIIRLDGKQIEWKEAFLRHIVMLILTILSIIVMTICLLKADDETYTSLGWLQRSQYLMSLSPLFFKLYTWTSNIWIYSEFIVLLTNKRKRAIHDYIAGTVIVKSKYINQIREYMNTENHQNNLTDNK